jgi:hypothetical protein
MFFHTGQRNKRCYRRVSSVVLLYIVTSYMVHCPRESEETKRAKICVQCARAERAGSFTVQLISRPSSPLPGGVLRTLVTCNLLELRRTRI